MHVLKNLRSLISGNRLIFILILICITVSTLVIQFSYGIYQNYHVTIQKGESEYRELEIEFANKPDDYVKIGDVLECAGMFSPNLYNSIDFCSVIQEPYIYRDTYDITIDENDYQNAKKNYKENTGEDMSRDLYLQSKAKDIMISFAFDEYGAFTNPKNLQNNFEINHFLEGRWFKNDEYDNENVCIIGIGNNVQRIPPYKDDKGREVLYIDYDGQTLHDYFTDEFGDTYKIISCSGLGATIFPANCVNKEYRMDNLFLEMRSPITFTEYNELKKVMEGTLGDKVKVPDIEFAELSNTYLYKTILLICGLVSIAAGINFIILFHFIMMKRRKKIAVFRLCGCTHFRCVIMCLSECLILTIPLYVIFTFIYDRFIMPLFSDIYPYMEAANSFKIYAVLGTLYIGITTLITLVMLIRDIRLPIASVQKGGN